VISFYSSEQSKEYALVASTERYKLWDVEAGKKVKSIINMHSYEMDKGINLGGIIYDQENQKLISASNADSNISMVNLGNLFK